MYYSLTALRLNLYQNLTLSDLPHDSGWMDVLSPLSRNVFQLTPTGSPFRRMLVFLYTELAKSLHLQSNFKLLVIDKNRLASVWKGT